MCMHTKYRYISHIKTLANHSENPPKNKTLFTGLNVSFLVIIMFVLFPTCCLLPLLVPVLSTHAHSKENKDYPPTGDGVCFTSMQSCYLPALKSYNALPYRQVAE